MPTRTSSLSLAPPPWNVEPRYSTTEPRGISAGDDSLDVNAHAVRQAMAVGHDARRAVGVGEVFERPDAADLDIHVGGKREEVEAPLVAVQHLRRRTGADRDRLSEVQLERRLLRPQRSIDDVEDQRVGHHRHARRATGQQRTGAARVAPGELVAAGRCLGTATVATSAQQPVAQLGVGETFDDDRTVIAQTCAHFFGRHIGGETRYRRRTHTAILEMAAEAHSVRGPASSQALRQAR